MLSFEKGRTKYVTADMLTIPLYVRSGTIIFEQEPELTTTAQAKNPMTLNIYYDNGTHPIHGTLFWDDGISQFGEKAPIYMKYTYNQGTVLLI